MRPLRLVLRAFGPYPGEQALDFTELRDRSLFLIHGPTGAGKTTILDAVCFALYGATSGAERDSRDMRSHAADPSRRTQVIFDFSLGRETYRVERSPQQELPRKRGAGTRTEPPHAALWKRTGLAPDGPEGTVVATQWSRVTEEIERLFRFRVEQFRQVVLLPQGQFQKLLLSSSRDRQEILEALFQTEVYRRIEEALKEASRSLEAEMKDLAVRRREVLEQSRASAPEELEARKTDALAQLGCCRESVEKLRREEGSALDALRAARTVVEKIRERDEADAALNKIEARRSAVAEDEARLDRARRAARLVHAEGSLQDRLEEAQAGAQALEKARASLAAARAALEESRAAHAREVERQGERDEAGRTLHRLEDLSGTVDDLCKARKLFEAEAEALSMLSLQRDRARKDLEAIQRGIIEKKKLVEEARGVSAGLEPLRMALEQGKRDLEVHRRLAGTLQRLFAARSRQAEASTGLREAEESLRRHREEAAAVERSWLERQAAILARGLEPGKPCPVCGSTEHPAPARAEGKLPTESALKKGRKEADAAQERREATLRLEVEAARAASALEAEAGALEETLRAGAAAEDKESLERTVLELEAKLGEATGAAARAASLENELQALEGRREDSASGAKAAEEASSAAATRLEGLRGALSERERAVPEELRDPARLGAAKVEAKSRLELLEKSLKSAEEAAGRCAQDAAAREAELKAAEEAAVRSGKRAEEESREFALRLKEEGFEGPEYFRAAKLPAREILRLEEATREFQGSLRAAAERRARAGEAAAGLSPPDLAALEAAARSAAAAKEKALEQEAMLRRDAAEIDGWLSRLREAGEKQAALESRHSVLGRVSEVASGKNALGITFERFVLASLLDDVLVAASQRLRLMSRQRYTLHRARERSDQRSAGGLDLEVCDAYSGTLRPVGTLSGGETFLASLSLALGLADVVQAYSGGIFLETIFVDEGFGSLDSEALDLALRALVDLQAGGRLVGIISHVAELKERIDARLEVTAGRHGSSARFVVG